MKSYLNPISLVLILSLFSIILSTQANGQVVFPLGARIPSNYSNDSMVALLHMNGTINSHINASDSPYRPQEISLQNSPVISTACVPYGVSGTNRGCGNFISETNGYILSTYFTSQIRNRRVTFGSWINVSAFTAGNTYITAKLPLTDSTRVYAYTVSTDSNRLHVGIGGNADVGSCSIPLGTQNWIHWAVRINGSIGGTVGNWSIFVNGTKCGDGTMSSWQPSADNWNIGFHPTDGVDFDGEMSEYFIFNYTMNDSEIQSIYNGTIGTPPAAPAPVFATINFTNIVNQSLINFTNITLANTTHSWNFTTINGSLNLFTNITFNAGLYNITGRVLNHYNFFIANYNLTQTNVFSVGQGKLNVTQFFLVSRSISQNFTIRNNLFVNSSNLDGSGSNLDLDVFVNLGNNTLNISGLNFTNFLVNISYEGNLTNLTYISNVTNKRFKFNITDSFTGNPLSSFSITLMNSSYNYSSLFSTTGFELLLDLENVSLIAQVAKTNYTTQNFSISTQSNFSNTTFGLTRTNILNLSIRYEPNRLPILNGTMIQVLLIGQSFSTNQTIFNTTQQGNTSFLFTDVPSGEYEIRYEGMSGFHQRSKYVTITSDGFVSTDLYLLDNANSTEITFTITDQFGRVLPNATVKALRYYNDLGGGLGNGFIEVEAARTNFVGVAIMNLQRPNVFYKFLIEYNGVVLEETAATELTSASFAFQVSTTGSILDSFVALNSQIYANISFVNTSSPNYFRGTFSTPTGLLRYACLRVEQQKFTANRLIGESCLTASSGSITININESDEASYVAQMYVDTVFTNSRLPVAQLAINLVQTFKTFGIQGLLYAFVFIGILVTVGAFNPVTGIAMAILGLLVVFFAGMTFYTSAIIMLIVASGIILASRLKT